jgi:dTDP-4-amino-4,6-dideoxygalactose transaminase
MQSLFLNGSPFRPHPSVFPLVPLAVPYWNSTTYRAILRSFLTGSLIDGSDLGKLRSLLAETFGVNDAVLCGSGSLALEIALRACNIREGDEVVIPTFCCTAVVAPVLAVGALPVFADVGEELNLTVETVDTALTQKTKAVIVPHLFGNPADINSIVEHVHGKDIRVIDDAAQALGATIAGHSVGSFGDAGVLSFGDEKVCSGLGGGVVISRQQEVLDRCLQVDLEPAMFSMAARGFLSTVIRRRWRRWTLPLQKSLSRTETNSPDSPPTPYRKEIMANLNAAVAFNLMGTLHENIAARRARAHAYQEILGAEQRLALISHRLGSACLSQVVRVLPARRGDDVATRLIDVLASAGYEVQGSYVPIHLLPYYERWTQNSLPYAERVWPDLIELPCEPSVSFDHVERIANIVKEVVRV